jgi:hypothetical protein
MGITNTTSRVRLAAAIAAAVIQGYSHTPQITEKKQLSHPNLHCHHIQGVLQFIIKAICQSLSLFPFYTCVTQEVPRFVSPRSGEFAQLGYLPLVYIIFVFDCQTTVVCAAVFTLSLNAFCFWCYWA